MVEMLRKQARLVAWLVTIPFVGLAILTALLLGNVLFQGGRYADAVVVYYLPMWLYMWAIWMVRRALLLISAGALFESVVPSLLARVGLALFAGAVFTVFGQPLANALLYGAPYFRTFEPSPVTLGIIGAALFIVG